MKSILLAVSFASSMVILAEDDLGNRFEKSVWRIGGVESAKTVEKIKEGLPFAKDWKSFDWQGNKLLVGLSVAPTFGESHVDLHGYIYNRHFKEWRRFCAVKTRNLGWAEVGLDEKAEELFLLAKANTPMKGKRVFRYSLLLLSDDRGYLPEAEDDGVDHPSATQEEKSQDKEEPESKSEGPSRDRID